MKKSPFHYLSKGILAHLGNRAPTLEHIRNMTKLLANLSLDSQIVTDKKLSTSEAKCLLLAAYGKTSLESAKILNIGKSTVETHRKEARRKLGSSSMAQAVYLGIRYGYVKNK